MQFGSRTYTQWQDELDAPPPAPRTSVPRPPTWAVRISARSTGIASPSKLPKPCLPPACTPDTSSASLAPPSAPSASSSPPTPPPSPRPVTKKRRRAPRAVTDIDKPALPPRALRGLVNCGNSCFTNVVLQALLACDPFRRLLLDCREIQEDDTLLAKFVRLADEMTVREDKEEKEPNGHANGPKSKRENGFVAEEPLVADWFLDVFPSSIGAVTVSGSGGSQEDAEEFLTFVLNGLHEELVELDKLAEEDDGDHGRENGRGGAVVANGIVTGVAKANAGGVWNGVHHTVDNEGGNGVWEEITRKGKTVEIRGGEFAQSGITDIFGGALRSEIRRGRAKPSVTREPFFSLSLDIESGMIRDVEHALTAYFEPEQLEGYTMEVASRGGEETVVEARKQVLLQMMPQVLVLHLKRFAHNNVTGALNKVSRLMPFPETLDVKAGLVYGGGGNKYALTAVVTHIGKDLAGGHYTCDVRWGGTESDVWISCDDSKVVKTSLQKVLRKQAYLLFYSLQKSSQPVSGRFVR